MENFTKYPKPGVPKLSKKASGYVAKGPFGCENCRWFQGIGQQRDCAVTGTIVDAKGCCDYWDEADAPKGVGKAKAEYIFVLGSNYTCAECLVFDPRTKTCSYVEGSIAPEASCDKFQPKVGGSMTQVDDLKEVIRESALAAVREAGFATRGSSTVDGPASGTFPPSGAVETGGQMMTPPLPAGGAPGGQGEMRGAAQSKGSSGFFTGEGAPLETADFPPAASGPSHHVSDDHGDPGIPGPSEHVSECAVCGHTSKLHEVKGLPAGQCLYCGPRGSLHTFATTVDHTPRLVTTPLMEGTMLLSPPEAHRRMFSEAEQAQIRLDEAINPAAYSSDGTNDTKEKADTYNAHASAANRQSLQAYSSGDHSHHHVAAAHHELAADAATSASNGQPDGSQMKKDYKTMASFHGTQAEAHKKAALAAHKNGLSNHINALSTSWDY